MCIILSRYMMYTRAGDILHSEGLLVTPPSTFFNKKELFKLFHTIQRNNGI